MALAKYAEEIQEAIYERMAIREREYTYDFKTTSHGKEEKQATQKGGKLCPIKQ